MFRDDLLLPRRRSCEPAGGAEQSEKGIGGNRGRDGGLNGDSNFKEEGEQL